MIMISMIFIQPKVRYDVPYQVVDKSQFNRKKESVSLNKTAPIGDLLGASDWCLFRKTGMAHGVENIEIV